MRKSWTEKMVASELMSVVELLGSFPSSQDLKNIGRSDLSSAITRNGGFEGWASRLGVERGQSNSDTGWDGEKELMTLLESRGFKVQRMSGAKSPFDLLIDDSVRIDVKSAKFAEYGRSRGWFYRLGKYPQADVVAFYQLDTSDCYFVPWWICPTSNVTISQYGGIYSAYKNRFDLLKLQSEAKLNEQKIWPEFA